MSSAVSEIRKSLNLIRSELEAADWQLRLEVLELIMTTGEQVVADLRKLKEPKVKKIRKKVIVPKTQLVTRFVDEPRKQPGPPANTSTAAIQPQAALPPQQTG
jgi:hypothetical protein